LFVINAHVLCVELKSNAMPGGRQFVSRKLTVRLPPPQPLDLAAQVVAPTRPANVFGGVAAQQWQRSGESDFLDHMLLISRRLLGTPHPIFSHHPPSPPNMTLTLLDWFRDTAGLVRAERRAERTDGIPQAIGRRT
jgi:hypothetical protein